MKTILSWGGHHYVAIFSIFLVTSALIAGAAGCGGGVVYDLTITSADGGSVMTPGEGMFPYDTGTVVNLVAIPDPGYQFGNWTGDVGTITDVYVPATNITMQGDYSITANFFRYLPVTAAGYNHTVAIKEDLTVAAVGDNSSGQCDVGGWTDIIQVAAGGNHTVGLKDDGSVVAVGNNSSGQCDVGGWTDITYVAAGGYHTLGVKEDGTVVAVGNNSAGQCEVGDWTDIVQVTAGLYHTVGLTDDGYVLCSGDDSWGQCDCKFEVEVEVIYITQVDAGWYHTVACTSLGYAFAWGNNACGQCDVSGLGWSGIMQVAAGGWHSVGLHYRGSVIAVGPPLGWECLCDWGQCNVYSWRNIVEVDAGYLHTEGVKCDEEGCNVVAVGYDFGEVETYIIVQIFRTRQ